MSNHLHKLSKELGLTKEDLQLPEINVRRIQRTVDKQLNARPYERRLYMKQRFLKTLTITAIVAAVGFSTVFALEKSDFLERFFAGDTSYFEQHVQEIKQSVQDENYKVTIEQVLASPYQVYMVYSIEALSEKAAVELNAIDEYGYDSFLFKGADISFVPQSADLAQIGGYGGGELKEKRTPTKRYYTLSSEELGNPNNENFLFRFNKITPPQDIVISMENNIETKEIVLNTPSAERISVQLSPLGINIARPIGDKYNKPIRDVRENPLESTRLGVYFRMSNDEIRTFSELLTGVSQLGNSSDNILMTQAKFRKIMILSDFKSIIIDNIEYDLENTAIQKPFIPENSSTAFLLDAYAKDLSFVPLRELCDNIGAEITWDAAAGSATVQYRGSTYVITADSSAVVKDGENHDNRLTSDDTTAFLADGEMMVHISILELMEIDLTSGTLPELGTEIFTWLVIP